MPAALVDGDPGFRICDIEVRVGPVHAPGFAVEQFVPAEAFLEIELLLPRNRQAAQQIEVGVADLLFGEGSFRHGAHKVLLSCLLGFVVARAQLAPEWASASFEIASSMVKLFGFWIGGKSLNVAANADAAAWERKNSAPTWAYQSQ